MLGPKSRFPGTFVRPATPAARIWSPYLSRAWPARLTSPSRPAGWGQPAAQQGEPQLLGRHQPGHPPVFDDHGKQLATQRRPGAEDGRSGRSYALLVDGTTLTIRPSGPGDYEAVRRLHETMSPENR